MTTVSDKWSVKIEKALHFCVEDMKSTRVSTDSNVLCQKALSLYKDFSKRSPKTSDHIYITFITVYCYNCFILLDTAVNLLLCLIYK